MTAPKSKKAKAAGVKLDLPVYSGNVDLIVQIANNVPIKEVSKRLKKGGYFVERELPISGVIGVKGATADIERIGRIDGVKFVKLGGSFRAI